MARQVYKCENCDLEFNEEYDCANHEIECLDEKSKVRINFNKAINVLVNKYNIIIGEMGAELFIADSHDYISKHIDVYFNGKLPNGNEISFINPYWSAEHYNVKDFIDEIEEFSVIPQLETSYEGEIWGSLSYEDEFKIGNIEVNEICRRFHGKKVKIEIIN